MQDLYTIIRKPISVKKAPKSGVIHDHIVGTSKMQLVENMHEHYLPPIMNKREWLHMPKLGTEKISVSEIKKFVIEKQDNKDSCGICAGKMVINTLLHKRGDAARISEQDINNKIISSKLVKEYVGVTPGQLKISIDTLLSEHDLPYTARVKKFVSYDDLKSFLKNGSYVIFSYMGNSIDNPYDLKDGQKDPSLKNIHHPHYAVLLGIDEENKNVTIANPFGHKEEIDFKEFRQRISLHPKYLHSSPLYIPLVESGLYMPRTCIIVTSNT